jgi:hypothetical protein
MPEVLLMVATELALVDHMPPEDASVSVTVEPAQTDVGPTIDAGSGFTTKVAVENPTPLL